MYVAHKLPYLCSIEAKGETHPKVSFLSVLLATHFTREGLLAGMRDQVPLHRGDADEPLAADAAHRQDLGRTLPIIIKRGAPGRGTSLH
jgi:hypothetical protein